MYSQDINRDLPNLNNSNHQITSPPDKAYNCIAWAAGEDDRWWWPDPFKIAYWPPEAIRNETVEAFAQAFKTRGYTICDNGDFVKGLEKLVLFIDQSGKPTHMARQLQDGIWTSKCGEWCDIAHLTPDVVAKGAYGSVGRYFSRKRQ